MNTWHWHTWQSLPYLTCDLLNSWSHGFFTQQFSPQTPEKLVTALNPQAPVYRVKQVHGKTVLTPSDLQQLDPEIGESLQPADGLVTEQSTQSVWVCTADCTPVLIADRQTGQVAAVHAGWRGTAQRIVPEAIEQLQRQGSRLADLRIAMGPAIAGEVYQVSTSVAAELATSLFLEAIATEEIISQLKQIPDSPIFDDPQPDKVRVDVRRVNALQLEQMGIAPEQVAIAPYCTYQQPEHFFSYRRTAQKQVQWSGIVSQ